MRQLAGWGHTRRSRSGHERPALSASITAHCSRRSSTSFSSAKIADATAAEVADSINRYNEARKLLSGYQIVLDLLLAEHFGMPKAKALVTSGSDLDLSRPGAHSWPPCMATSEKKLVAQVEALAQRPDLRFFHWEIEFPEVFFGLLRPEPDQIMHKDKIKPGSAGFDVVIGNPPYVRQESIKPLKSFLKDEVSDLRQHE